MSRPKPLRGEYPSGRKVKGLAVPAPRASGRSGSSSMPSTCIACMAPIDLGLVSLAIGRGRVYTHGCGRVLFDPAHGTMEPML